VGLLEDIRANSAVIASFVSSLNLVSKQTRLSEAKVDIPS